jgi:hypothetical protein
VYLIAERPIISPKQAERLMSVLWQQSAGSTLALFLVGRGDGRPQLGVASPNRLVAEDAADVVARAVDGAAEPGFVLIEEILSAPHLGVRHITPMYRGFRTDSQSWGWDRADNLHDTYDLLRRVPAGRVAGFVLAFRTLPGLLGLTSMMVFAAGGDRAEVERVVYSLAATYAGTGARVSRLLNPRRFLVRGMRAQVSTTISWLRPHSVIRVEEMSAFWHPRLSETRATLGAV